ncbi:MAG: hypothetical protein R3B90_17050 [Planctomycetaceae bacterium]
MDRDQKARLGWIPPETEPDRSGNLFDHFRARAKPHVPRPGEAVRLALDWPAEARVKSLRLRIQTDEYAPWIEVAVPESAAPPESIPVGNFDRPTPISWRIDAALEDGQSVELWGYFQVRSEPNVNPQPLGPRRELLPPPPSAPPAEGSPTAQ